MSLKTKAQRTRPSLTYCSLQSYDWRPSKLASECWPPTVAAMGLGTFLGLPFIRVPPLPASGLSIPACLSAQPRCLHIFLHICFKTAPGQLVYPSGGPSVYFSPNYALATATTDTKTNGLGVRGGGGSDRLVPGGLIKGHPLGLRGDESCPQR